MMTYAIREIKLFTFRISNRNYGEFAFKQTRPYDISWLTHILLSVIHHKACLKSTKLICSPSDKIQQEAHLHATILDDLTSDLKIPISKVAFTKKYNR